MSTASNRGNNPRSFIGDVDISAENASKPIPVRRLVQIVELGLLRSALSEDRVAAARALDQLRKLADAK